MASNKIVIEVQLDDSGSFKLVEQQAKKAAKATDDLGKSRNRYNKGEKGVIGATANGTKAFSKMRDSMTGSTGLVSAYAVLASNVFAATAAFNAFRRAAQVQQLEAGLVAVGAAAGANLRDVSEGLRRITGEALSAEQSMRATALATASGFRTDQLQDLARVAKGASLALGRDMGDAFDRLVRGTAKVEPEILDELGIFVRLDDAVSTYATQLGVAENSLTQYDRSQAFLNATLEQGLKKYQDLSETIDPNPYDQLSAALADLQKEVLGFFNNFAGLGDAVAFASRNLYSLTAVATTLGAAVTSTIAPGLLRMAESSAESAEGLFQARSEMAKTLTQGKGLPPLFTSLSGKLEDGTATSKDFGQAQASLLGKLGANQRQLNAFEQSMKRNNDTSKEAQAELERLTNTKADLQSRLSSLKDLQTAQTDASISASRASALNNASSLKLVDAFKDLGQAHKEDAKRTREGAKEKRGFGKALSLIGPAARTGAGGLKVLGAAFFTFLPYIGLIISGISVLYGVIKEKFFPEDVVKNRIDEARDSFEAFSEITESFQQSSAEGNVRLVNSYIAYAGILDQLIGKLKEIKDLNDQEYRRSVAQNKLDQAAKRREIEAKTAAADRLRSQGGRGPQGQTEANYRAQAATARRELEALKNEAVTLGEEARENNLLTFTSITEGFLAQFKAQRAIAAENEENNPFALSIAEKQIRQLEAIMASVADKTSLTEVEFQKLIMQVQNLGRQPSNVRNAFQQVADAIATTNSSVTKLVTGVKKPFQDIEDGLENTISLAEDLEKRSKGPTAEQAATLPLDQLNDVVEESAEYKKLLDELDKDLGKLRIPQRFLDANKTNLDAAKAYLAEIHRIQGSLKTLTENVEKAEVANKRMVEITKGITGTQFDRDKAANAVRAAKVALLEEEITALKTVTDLDGEQVDNTAEIVKKQAEILKLEGQQVDLNETLLEDQIALTAETAKQNSLKAEQVQNDLRILKLQQALSGSRTTPIEENQLKLATAQAAVTAAQMELNLVNARAELEEALFILRIGGAENIGEAEKAVLDKLRAQLEITRQIAEEKVRGAQLGVTEELTNRVTEEARTPGVRGMRGLDETALGGQDGAESFVGAKETVEALKEQLAFGQFATMEEIEAVQGALEQAQRNVATAGINMVATTLDNQAKALEKLGPEGELAAAFATFGADMLVNMDAFAEAGENTAERIAAGFAMAASAIQGISSIMAAKSKSQIAEVDNQIAAEKRRDGKSKESLAKIAAMEKKKEALQKKAFEQNKKMQMATVIANTAMSIAANMAAASIAATQAGLAAPAVFAGYLGLMNGITIAMGAAQLAVIAGTSYNGGGSIGGDGGGSTSITMGSRKDSVDLSRSQSARGELAYFRGESGSGGPENFRNAFSGYRNRAGGGNTAFMVGEQGPELFVPETPGTIVPSDEVAQAAPTNVNFSISAVDAAGVEDLLIRQQGNIIGMIREAANSYGQDFVETVDTSVFNDTTGGVSRY